MKLNKDILEKNVRNKKVICILDLLYLIVGICILLNVFLLVTTITHKSSIWLVISVTLLILYIIDRFAELMQYRMKYPNDEFGAFP